MKGPASLSNIAYIIHHLVQSFVRCLNHFGIGLVGPRGVDQLDHLIDRVDIGILAVSLLHRVVLPGVLGLAAEE